MITLEQAKKHLNIDDYLTEDDGYIGELITTAEAVISSSICRTFEELDEQGAKIATHAVLLLIGEYYSQREDTIVGASPSSIPHGVERLCNLIRKYE